MMVMIEMITMMMWRRIMVHYSSERLMIMIMMVMMVMLIIVIMIIMVMILMTTTKVRLQVQKGGHRVEG